MLCYYAAGCLSGVVGFLISYPLDTIKIQQQYRGLRFFEAANRIMENRGWRGFYRGSLAPLVGTVTLNSVFFGLYGDTKDYLIHSRRHQADLYWAASTKINPTPYHPHHKPYLVVGPERDDVDMEEEENEPTFRETILSGVFAGFVVLGLTAPFELVKTKLQSQMKRRLFKGPMDCCRKVFKEAGFKAFFRGIVPMALRNVTCSGVKLLFACSVLKLCDLDLFPVNDVQVLAALAAVGVASWVVALPFDAIKTRMQADDHKNPQYKGMAHVTKDLYKTNGFKGFYRGFWNVTTRVVPVHCATYVVYTFYVQSQRCHPHHHSQKSIKK